VPLNDGEGGDMEVGSHWHVEAEVHDVSSLVDGS
jgi:hypothetical protein